MLSIQPASLSASLPDFMWDQGADQCKKCLPGYRPPAWSMVQKTVPLHAFHQAYPRPGLRCLHVQYRRGHGLQDLRSTLGKDCSGFRIAATSRDRELALSSGPLTTNALLAMLATGWWVATADR